MLSSHTALALTLGLYALALDIHQVPVIDDDVVDLVALAHQRQPYVLANLSLVHQWPARNWTLGYIASQLPVVPAYKQSQPHFRTFHDNKLLEPYLTKEKWHQYNVKVNVTTSELFAADRTRQPYYYFSSDIDKLAPFWPSLLADVTPHQQLLITNTGVQRNLWLGRAGIQTAMHYDASYNVFVQLHGSKQFTLIPPWAQMCLYPCLHPSIAHTQGDPKAAEYRTRCPVLSSFTSPEDMHINNADNNDDNADKIDIDDALDLSSQQGYSLFRSRTDTDIRAYQVVLHPSQALVLPPHWWHQVTTREDSVSFNAWSDAEEYVIIHKVYELALPFESTWPLAQLLAAAYHYLNVAIMMTLPGLEHASMLIYQHVAQQRWQPLLDGAELIREVQAIQRVNNACMEMPATQGQLDLAAISKAAAKASALLRTVALQSVREILLGNYVERVVALVLQDPSLVWDALQCYLTEKT